MAGEKRSQEVEEAQRNENIVLVDIEGTTTSISFVKETLFPYVREHLKDYIEKNWENAEFKEDLEKLKEQAKKDETDKVEGLIAITSATPEDEKETLVKNIFWQMDNDRKTGALKQLQGHMWREAYKSGAVKGHVYEDVPKALDIWTTSNKKIYVYSSGSVEAQKLLFAHSIHGDLLKHFTDHFDTSVGPKQEPSSYKTIISKLSVDPTDVLFLTDIPNEAKAAVEAGLSAILVIREGNASLSVEDKSTYPTINSFLDITFQTPVKRQKTDESAPEKKIEDPKKSESEDVEMTDLSDKKPEKDVKSTPEVSKKPTETPEPSKDTPKSPEKPPAPEKLPEPEKSEKMETESPETKGKDEEKSGKIEDKSHEKITPVDSEVPATTDKPEEKPEDAKVEAEVKKIEAEVKKQEIDDKSTEIVKSESTKIDDKVDKLVEIIPEKISDNSDKIVDKVEKSVDVVDDVKTEELDDKVENVGDVKQNGETKIEVSIEEKVKTNGDSKKKEETVKEAEEKEIVKDIKEIKEVKEVKDVEGEKDKDKGDENNDKCEEKKVNGNSETDDSHRNRNDVNETTKNGENSDDTIKVKKVVESIVDNEPDVVPPVAVVAATS